MYSINSNFNTSNYLKQLSNNNNNNSFENTSLKSFISNDNTNVSTEFLKKMYYIIYLQFRQLYQ